MVSNGEVGGNAVNAQIGGDVTDGADGNHVPDDIVDGVVTDGATVAMAAVEDGDDDGDVLDVLDDDTPIRMTLGAIAPAQAQLLPPSQALAVLNTPSHLTSNVGVNVGITRRGEDFTTIFERGIKCTAPLNFTKADCNQRHDLVRYGLLFYPLSLNSFNF